MTPSELRDAGILAIDGLTGAEAIDALIMKGLFPVATETDSRLIADHTEGGIRTAQWQDQVRHVTRWGVSQERS